MTKVKRRDPRPYRLTAVNDEFGKPIRRAFRMRANRDWRAAQLEAMGYDVATFEVREV